MKRIISTKQYLRSNINSLGASGRSSSFWKLKGSVKLPLFLDLAALESVCARSETTSVIHASHMDWDGGLLEDWQ
jgi:hypothetical protein